jgi:hypothetical protein
MAQEIEKFDPATLMQGVKDRIKATFVSLIPDDKWEEMCKAEIDKFFKTGNSYGSNYRDYSEFSWVVNSALRAHTEQKIKEVLSSEEFQVTWNGNNYDLSAAIKDELIKKAPEIFISSIEGMIGNVLMSLKNR